MPEPTKPKPSNCSPHGWTLDTLEEYLAHKISGLEKYFTDLSNEREIRTSERFNTSKEAVTAALAATKEAITVAMVASEKAIAKAETASEKRSEASNEIRAAMIDQQKNFADKAATEFRLSTIESRIQENMSGLAKRIEGLETSISTIVGRSIGIGSMGSTMIQILTVVAAVSAVAVTLFFKH